jgi:replicative DNA helicase
MIELQVINKVLQNKSLTLLRQNNIDAEYFITYKAEVDFMMKHYQQYGNIPDTETFMSEFKDFDLVEVHESDKYLIETLQEQFMYSKMVPFVHKLAELVTEDSKGAVQFIMSQMDDIKKLSSQYKTGYDIVKNSDDRRDEVKFRSEAKGLLGITTGIKELDEITHGWLKEDFIVIVGRTNEGKTWVMLFFLVAAWLSGQRVLLYSGEMSETLVGFRFDTLNAHFSNDAMMSGKHNLGSEEDPKSINDYFDYLDNLSTTDVPFVVCTPKHIGGKRMTIPVLHQLIEQYKPGIVGIDQLSLMDDYRASKGEQARLRYTHISEDLYLTSEKFGIPILSPAQANRDAKKNSKSNDETPELEHISESDGVGQNATRVISIKQLGPTMKLGLKKNRYGKNNQEVLLIWDIDKGVVKPFLQVSTNDAGEAEQTTIQTGVDLF